MDAPDFSQNFLLVLRISPLLTPVDVSSSFVSAALCCRLEDELSNVFVFGAVDSSVSKILDDVATIVANRSKVECVSTWIQGQNCVELLNKNRTGLMNSLPCVRMVHDARKSYHLHK